MDDSRKAATFAYWCGSTPGNQSNGSSYRYEGRLLSDHHNRPVRGYHQKRGAFRIEVAFQGQRMCRNCSTEEEAAAAAWSMYHRLRGLPVPEPPPLVSTQQCSFEAARQAQQLTQRRAADEPKQMQRHAEPEALLPPLPRWPRSVDAAGLHTAASKRQKLHHHNKPNVARSTGNLAQVPTAGPIGPSLPAGKAMSANARHHTKKGRRPQYRGVANAFQPRLPSSPGRPPAYGYCSYKNQWLVSVFFQGKHHREMHRERRQPSGRHKGWRVRVMFQGRHAIGGIWTTEAAAADAAWRMHRQLHGLPESAPPALQTSHLTHTLPAAPATPHRAKERHAETSTAVKAPLTGQKHMRTPAAKGLPQQKRSRRDRHTTSTYAFHPRLQTGKGREPAYGYTSCKGGGGWRVFLYFEGKHHGDGCSRHDTEAEAADSAWHLLARLQGQHPPPKPSPLIPLHPGRFAHQQPPADGTTGPRELPCQKHDGAATRACDSSSSQATEVFEHRQLGAPPAEGTSGQRPNLASAPDCCPRLSPHQPARQQPPAGQVQQPVPAAPEHNFTTEQQHRLQQMAPGAHTSKLHRAMAAFEKMPDSVKREQGKVKFASGYWGT
ncbi:hypothetical protein WJX73_009144 [Symbiochloris irregularis]|uniref:AP2/ERF domain-containing protein n=1 Tax=Symbiochloris irregularis TaxID=706552 RepID=A0AAW1PF54_9CHLO